MMDFKEDKTPVSFMDWLPRYERRRKAHASKAQWQYNLKAKKSREKRQRLSKAKKRNRGGQFKAVA